MPCWRYYFLPIIYFSLNWYTVWLPLCCCPSGRGKGAVISVLGVSVCLVQWQWQQKGINISGKQWFKRDKDGSSDKLESQTSTMPLIPSQSHSRLQTASPRFYLQGSWHWTPHWSHSLSDAVTAEGKEGLSVHTQGVPSTEKSPELWNSHPRGWCSPAPRLLPMPLCALSLWSGLSLLERLHSPWKFGRQEMAQLWKSSQPPSPWTATEQAWQISGITFPYTHLSPHCQLSGAQGVCCNMVKKRCNFFTLLIDIKQ